MGPIRADRRDGGKADFGKLAHTLDRASATKAHVLVTGPVARDRNQPAISHSVRLDEVTVRIERGAVFRVRCPWLTQTGRSGRSVRDGRGFVAGKPAPHVADSHLQSCSDTTCPTSNENLPSVWSAVPRQPWHWPTLPTAVHRIAPEAAHRGQALGDMTASIFRRALQTGRPRSKFLPSAA